MADVLDGLGRSGLFFDGIHGKPAGLFHVPSTIFVVDVIGLCNQVVDKDDVSVGMELDENHTVLVYQLDAVSDINFFKSMLESAGCEFGDAQELKVGNFEATQSTYKFDETQGYFYICSDGGKPIVVADGMPASEELPAAEDSPAYQVINSLE